MKIYLDASVEVRATRRFKENKERGINQTYEEIKEAIIIRDHVDKNKDMGALKITNESIYIDSSEMEIEEVVDKIANIIVGAKR